MGWFRFDNAEHEGFFVACERDSDGLWRELGLADEDRGEVPIRQVQVGCSCGWRTPRMVAPFGTVWAPFVTVFPKREESAWEDAAVDVWLEHIGVVDPIRALLEKVASR